MYLVDTNIWLEVLLNKKTGESHEFLEITESSFLHITDFSLYSIGIILTRLKKSDVLNKFVSDVIIESNVSIIRLNPEDIKKSLKLIPASILQASLRSESVLLQP